MAVVAGVRAVRDQGRGRIRRGDRIRARDARPSAARRRERRPRAAARPTVLRTRASARPTAGTRRRPTPATGSASYRRPLAARPGRPLDPRRQLHRLLLVEDPRQGRARHLGDPADRLPVQRPRHPRLRAARLPARRLLLLVRLLAAAPEVPLRPRRPARDVPRGEGRRPAIRSRPGRRSSRTPSAPAPTSRSAARAASCARPGTRSPSWSPPPTSTRSRSYGPDRIAGFSPIPAMSMVSYTAGTPLPLADRRRLPLASTTGTPTCRRPRRRSGATRPTSPSRPTGGTPPT